MNHAHEQILNFITYCMTLVGIVVNLDTIKGLILFCGAVILLILQIYLHIIKIKKEKKDNENR